MFGRLEAVDADAGDNAKIRFEVLEPKQTPFRVHPETGDVTVVSMRSLHDLLVHKYYELKVKAENMHVTPSLSSNATITIGAPRCGNYPQLLAYEYSSH